MIADNHMEDDEDGGQVDFPSLVRGNFLKGCYYNEEDEEYKKLEEERTAKMREEVRDIDGFDWAFNDETYEGVTLKHAFDMIGQYKQIQYEHECPTPCAEPYFREFVARGHNQLDKLDPEDGHEMPDHWFDWHRDVSCEEW